MKWVIGYVACPFVGGLIIWWKQGWYLTEQQPMAFVLFGPIMPLIALLPRSFFTSRAQAEGRDG
jgi:hypothetical protein